MTDATRAEVIKRVQAGSSWRAVAEDLGLSKDAVGRAVRRAAKKEAKDASPAPPVSPATGGILLQGREVLAEKPTSPWPSRFSALRTGCGYPLDVLAGQWHTTVEQVRAKARGLKCLRYVAGNDGDFIACAVHPSTPGGK